MAVVADETRKKRRKLVRVMAGPAAADLGTTADVVDCHSYLLPPFDSTTGATLRDKCSELQKVLATTQSQSFTLQTEPTRCFVDSSSLADLETLKLQEGLVWARDELGRVSWQVGGKRFVKGNLPSYVSTQGNAYSADQLVAAMDFADVSTTILQHRDSCGDLGDLYREAFRRHPDRFRRLITVPQELLAPGRFKAAIACVDKELAFGGVAGFQCCLGSLCSEGVAWDGDDMNSFWDYLAHRQVSVWFTMSTGYGASLNLTIGASEELFKKECDRIVAWCRRYENTDVVITHGLPWRNFLHTDRRGIGPLPKWAFKIFEPPRVHMELLIPACIGDVFDFPYKEVAPMLERLSKRVGAKRLMFGSEMPFLERSCTYYQSIRYMSHYCEFLTLDERVSLLGGNTRRLLQRADAVPRPTEVPGSVFNRSCRARAMDCVGRSILELDTPCLLLDMDMFDRNCSEMDVALGSLFSRGLLLRPEVSAHGSVDLARRQLAQHGKHAKGVCCQSVDDVEASVRGGIHDVALTCCFADSRKAARLGMLVSQGIAVRVCVDNVEQVAMLKDTVAGLFGGSMSAGREAADIETARSCVIGVVVELGNAGGTSASNISHVASLVQDIIGVDGLAFQGFQVSLGSRSYDERSVADSVQAVKAHVAALRNGGITTEIVICVANETPLPLGNIFSFPEDGVRQELQRGAYDLSGQGGPCGSGVEAGSDVGAIGAGTGVHVLGTVVGAYDRAPWGRHCVVDVGHRDIAALPRVHEGDAANSIGLGDVAVATLLSAGPKLEYRSVGDALGVLLLEVSDSDEEQPPLKVGTQLFISPQPRVTAMTTVLHEFVFGFRKGIVEEVFRVDVRRRWL
eukprot:TRINITY_DN33234_c0_g1_i1.p1 TRINITY_DN33234_c0_g1~~TRINITY_DN33234_c0_g1_i1.p1  ORF type:complete len:855 (+),score=137.90 TRINITY_DN33234_c0_g1_i1:101-2665(+)